MGFLDMIMGKKKVMPVSVNDKNFRSVVIDNPKPVILDIWGPNCAPCKQMEDVIVTLATDYQDRVTVAEMNIQGAMKTAGQLRVSATPTLIYFQGGREKERSMGFRGSQYHREMIEEIFGISK